LTVFAANVRGRLFLAVAPSSGEAQIVIRRQILASGSSVDLGEIAPERFEPHPAEHVVGKRADRFRKLHGRAPLEYGARDAR
jgi:hypothetical protein